MITDRMLKMFKRKTPKAAAKAEREKGQLKQ
jgi:hypothetical protein